MKYYLAIDIGASSGRHILFHLNNNQLILEEIYRFSNKMIQDENHLYWNIDHLFEEIVTGLHRCKEIDKIPVSIGIDTWGVDYVLVDSLGKRVREVYAYRDNRTVTVIHDVHDLLSIDKLYEQTGIQFQPFNTIYQLASEEKEVLKRAKHFLMIPDYINYLLTNRMVNEYTNLSTTQLLNCYEKKLDSSILKQIGISKSLFVEQVNPGVNLGGLRKEIQNIVGFDTQVIVPATHDSGSAYISCLEPNSILLSSGTWSLLGIISKKAIIDSKAQNANFTNEGGYNGTYRFLKNIMGLWIIQEVSRLYDDKYSFEQLVQLARESNFKEIFDVNHGRFLSPNNMIEEIQLDYKERNLNIPNSPGDLAYCVYHSLAHSYKQAIEELEEITEKKYSTINVLGGGCKNDLLNEMIAKICEKEVLVGPIEATAIGNVLVQLQSLGEITDLKQGRELIRKSFKIGKYEKGEENEKTL